MESIFQFITNFSSQIIISLAVALLGGLFFAIRNQRRWMSRSFFDRVSVSLNYVVDGEFQIRTLQEQSCVEVFRNSSIVKKVMTAAKRQKVEEILDLPPDDYWYFLNPVLNCVSEQFAPGFVREESGNGGNPQKYLMFLTGGQNENMRQRKVRALLIREELLLETATTEPRFRNEFHQLRWETLQRACEEWVESKGTTKRIREISLSV